MGIEDPDTDVTEQQLPATPVEVDEDGEEPDAETGVLPTEADPADVADQRAAVPEDDEYDH